MEGELRVIIVGVHKSGKSHLAVLIWELLEQAGVNAAIEDPDNDVTNRRERLSHPGRRMQLLDMLRTRHIVIQEVQLKREPPMFRPLKEPWWKRLFRRLGHE